MGNTRSKKLVEKETTNKITQEEKERRWDEILKQQAERNFLRPVKNDNYEKIFGLKPNKSDQPRSWF